MSKKSSPGLRVSLLSMHTDPMGTLGGDVTGGMNVYVRELARALACRGVQVDVFTRAEDPVSPPVQVIASGARLVRIPAGPRKPIDKFDLYAFTESFSAEITDFAEKESATYDLVSTHYWLSAEAGRHLSESWEVPLVHRFHTIAAEKNQALPTEKGQEPEERVRAEAQIARSADALFTSSMAETDFLASQMGASPTSIHVVPCGVNLERFRPSPQEDARDRLGIPKNHKILLHVGRIEPIKGLDRLVQILARMKGRQPDFEFHVLQIGGATHKPPHSSVLQDLSPDDFSSPGQRDEVRRIRELAEELGVGENFHFLGAQPQEALPLYYSAVDTLAVPSRYESFGLVVLEASACGLPAIAFDVGGISGAIENGKTGALVPDGDTDAFADRALEILADSELRGRLRHQGQERVKDFSWSSVASREIDVWKKVLQNRPGLQEGSTRTAWAEMPA